MKQKLYNFEQLGYKPKYIKTLKKVYNTFEDFEAKTNIQILWSWTQGNSRKLVELSAKFAPFYKFIKQIQNQHDLKFDYALSLWLHKLESPPICKSSVCNNYVKLEGRYPIIGPFSNDGYCSIKCKRREQPSKTKQIRDKNLKMWESLDSQEDVNEIISILNRIIKNDKSGFIGNENLLKEKTPNTHYYIQQFAEDNDLTHISFTRKVYHFMNQEPEVPKCPGTDVTPDFISMNQGYNKYAGRGSNMKDEEAVKNFTHNRVKQNGTSIKRKLNEHNIELLEYKDAYEIYASCKDCDCDEEMFLTNSRLVKSRYKRDIEQCIHRLPSSSGVSDREIEFIEFLESEIGSETIRNHRRLIGNETQTKKGKRFFAWELDLYAPDLNLAFEFNGLYYHSEEFKGKYYHQQKFLKCQEQGVKLIQIWEDEWEFKKAIVKSRIRNILGNTKNKIGARKLKVKKISNKQANDFIQENHLMGIGKNSGHRYGLFKEDLLLQVMTFSRNKEVWKCERNCTKMGWNVVGGTSKLFKHFERENRPAKIISYASLEWGMAGWYETVGFELDGYTEPGYYYYKSSLLERQNRFHYQKKKVLEMVERGLLKSPGIGSSEVEILKHNNYFRIFGPGNAKWVKK